MIGVRRLGIVSRHAKLAVPAKARRRECQQAVAGQIFGIEQHGRLSLMRQAVLRELESAHHLIATTFLLGCVAEQRPIIIAIPPAKKTVR